MAKLEIERNTLNKITNRYTTDETKGVVSVPVDTLLAGACVLTRSRKGHSFLPGLKHVYAHTMAVGQRV
jgi:hypothetical protein